MKAFIEFPPDRTTPLIRLVTETEGDSVAMGLIAEEDECGLMLQDGEHAYEWVVEDDEDSTD